MRQKDMIVEFVREHEPIWRSEIHAYMEEQGAAHHTTTCNLWQLVDDGVLENDNYCYSIADDEYTGADWI